LIICSFSFFIFYFSPIFFLSVSQAVLLLARGITGDLISLVIPTTVLAALAFPVDLHEVALFDLTLQESKTISRFEHHERPELSITTPPRHHATTSPRHLFSGAFPELRKATISFTSVCPNGTTRLPLDGFCLNLIFEFFFSKIC
jgi:hypothetical protein